MDRFLRRVLAFAFAGLAMASLAQANVPVPELSTVPACVVISPGAGALALTYRVTIVGTGGPINASAVQIKFNTVADTLICWCTPRPTPRPPVFSLPTAANGVAVFTIKGGGCIQNGLAAIPGNVDNAGEIFADGVKMQEFGVVSPDAVDASGKLATDSPTWAPGATCTVGLSDAVQHTTPLSTSVYQWCTDINCDHACGLSDGVILTPSLAQAANCAGVRGP